MLFPVITAIVLVLIRFDAPQWIRLIIIQIYPLVLTHQIADYMEGRFTDMTQSQFRLSEWIALPVVLTPGLAMMAPAFEDRHLTQLYCGISLCVVSLCGAYLGWLDGRMEPRPHPAGTILLIGWSFLYSLVIGPMMFLLIVMLV